MVPTRKETDNGSAGVYRNFFYLNGQSVGDVGTDQLASGVDYAQQMATDRSNTASAGNAPAVLTATPNVGLNANFDENYQADNASSVGKAGASYTVMAGNTLQSIAQAVWGDSSLWYFIADANGLDAGANLATGQSLSIPNQVTICTTPQGSPSRTIPPTPCRTPIPPCSPNRNPRRPAASTAGAARSGM